MQNISVPVAKKIKGISLRLLVVILLFILALSAFYLITNEAVLENDNQLTQSKKYLAKALCSFLKKGNKQLTKYMRAKESKKIRRT